ALCALCRSLPAPLPLCPASRGRAPAVWGPIAPSVNRRSQVLGAALPARPPSPPLLHRSSLTVPPRAEIRTKGRNLQPRDPVLCRSEEHTSELQSRENLV